MTVVKKLEWNEYNDEQGIPDRWDAEASSFGVFYSIEIQHDGYRVVFDHEAVGAVGVFGTLEAAKAAAQQDFEARILSALEPAATCNESLQVEPAAPEGQQPVKEAMELARAVLAQSITAGHNVPGPTPEDIEEAFWALDAALKSAMEA